MHRCLSVGVDVTSRSRRSALRVLSLGYLLTFSISYAVNVHLPKDRISMAHQGYGFCEFLTEEDAEYACKIMNQIKLWGKPIRVNKVRRRFKKAYRCSRSQGRPFSFGADVVVHAVFHWLLIPFPSNRRPRTKNNLTSVQISSLGTWTKMSTRDCCTTPSAHSALWRLRLRYAFFGFSCFRSSTEHCLSDCPRYWDRNVEGLRLCFVHRLRVL